GPHRDPAPQAAGGGRLPAGGAGRRAGGAGRAGARVRPGDAEGPRRPRRARRPHRAVGPAVERGTGADGVRLGVIGRQPATAASSRSRTSSPRGGTAFSAPGGPATGSVTTPAPASSTRSRK